MSCGCARSSSEASDSIEGAGSSSRSASSDGVDAQPSRIGSVKSRRGEALALWTWEPCGSHRGFAVLFHGYATNSHYPTVVWLAEVLVRAGIRCYSADMLGHGASEGLPGLLPSVEHLTQDGLDVVEAVRARHPGSKVFLCGSSMGGAIALLVGLLADFDIDGVVLLAPMLRQVKANLPHPGLVMLLRGLSYVAPSLAVIKTNAAQADLQYTDPARRQQCEEAPQYRGTMRLGTAATLVGCTEELQKRFEEVDFPFFVAMGGRDVIVDPEAAQELFDRAATVRANKVLRLYPAGQHSLLAQLSPLREEIEDDIYSWVTSRLSL